MAMTKRERETVDGHDQKRERERETVDGHDQKKERESRWSWREKANPHDQERETVDGHDQERADGHVQERE